MDVVYRANDNVIELSAVTNGQTDALIGGATVSVTLTDSTGATVTATGVSWPVTMSAVSGATGTYRGVLPYTLSLTADAVYYAEINCDAGTDLYASWSVPIRAKTRTG